MWCRNTAAHPPPVLTVPAVAGASQRRFRCRPFLCTAGLSCTASARRKFGSQKTTLPSRNQSTWQQSRCQQMRMAAGPLSSTELLQSFEGSYDEAEAEIAATMEADDHGHTAGAVGLSLSELWQLLQADRARLLACTAATAVSVCTAVAVAPSLGNVIDIISRGSASTPRQLLVAVGRLGAVYIISNVTLTLQVALSLALGEGLAHRLRCRLFGALLSRDTLFFDQVKTGQMVAWLGQDVEVLQATVSKLLGARGVRAAFETVGIIVVLFTLSWQIAAVLLVAAPLLTPLILRLTTTIGEASKASQAASSDVSAGVEEIVENMRVVKVFAQQHRELTRFGGLLDIAHGLALKVMRLQALLDAAGRLRNTLCIMAVLGMGSYMALHNTVSLGTLYSFFVYSFSLAFALQSLSLIFGDLAKASGAVDRAMTAMQEALGVKHAEAAMAVMSEWPQHSGMVEGEASTAADPATGEHGFTAAPSCIQQQPQQQQQGQLPDGWQGDIEFRGVGFSHPGWSGWTLQDLTFTIPAGKTTALVGPSGGGKSTIASMLMGLYEPARGEILVDGHPLSQLDAKWWRRQLGVVAQSPGLLTGRIADIIRYSRPSAPDSEVEWAAKAAQAHDFITALPQGYQTVIGAGSGMEVSGGQQQRLAIARALLHRPRVLILDEATAALDVETEQAVTRALEAAGRGVSSLVIAHRLSTVRRADQIIVVVSGRVAETGTHEQLMQRGGVYWGLVNAAESRGLDSWDEVPDEEADGAGQGAGRGQPPPAEEEMAAA